MQRLPTSESAPERPAAVTELVRPTLMVVAAEFDICKAMRHGANQRLLISPVNQAYSQIDRVHPDRIVVLMPFDDPASYRLLTVLRMNAETQQIPVVVVVTRDCQEECRAEDWAAMFPAAATDLAH